MQMQKTFPVILAALLCGAWPAAAQRPSDPALLVPQQAPASSTTSSPTTRCPCPKGRRWGRRRAVAFDKRKGHLIVLTRGTQAFFEFDDNGRYVRSFGDALFTRAHGLRIDGDGNYWTTDVGAHTVMKFSPDGRRCC